MGSDAYDPRQPYALPRTWLLEHVGANPITQTKTMTGTRRRLPPTPVAYRWRECVCPAAIYGVGDIWLLHPCEKHAALARIGQEGGGAT
jgi:hypothetical protein